MSTNESSRCCRLVSSGATDGSFSPRTQSERSVICMAQASAMLTPAIFDDRAPSLNRVPPHSGQVAKVTARSTNARMCGCIASTSFDSIDFCTFGMSPSKVRLMPLIFTFVGSRYRKSFSSVSL